MEFNELLTHQDKILVKNIITHIDKREYDKALDIIYQRLESLENLEPNYRTYLRAELGGFLIDICTEGKNLNAGEKGLDLLKSFEKDYKKYLWPASYDYNLGNGYDSIYKCKFFNKEIHYRASEIQLLNNAKNNFWRAYKQNLKDKRVPLQPNFLVNLGNSLSNAGRVVEAIQYYDLALHKYPDFPQAHVNRAEALLWLNKLSNSLSINLLFQSMYGFLYAAKSDSMPKWLSDIFSKKAKSIESYLEKENYSDFNFEEELEESRNEKSRLSKYRKFCLDNNLSLSEHAIYCHCSGARRDDLMIPTPSSSIVGQFVPQMEQILNRVKSEYSLARLLFYKSLQNDNHESEYFEDEVVYTELNDNEFIGIKPEMLRTSFRLCIGILDKIAAGICELFELSDKNENIYFESFWKSHLKKNPSQKQKERWDKINSINNPPLIALYSQAHDLNYKSGEWSVFKKWRNSMEHEIFVITNDKIHDDDIFNLDHKKRGIIVVTEKDFKEKTHQLLSFTRSAIFNFTFMVRFEGQKGKNPGDIGIPITFQHKSSNA